MSQHGSVLSRFGRIVAPLACAGLLSACSSTPDWANPVEWYKGAASVFESEPDSEVAKAREEAKAKKRSSPGADGEYPNLSSVPERPKELGAQRNQVQQGLAADRERARYADVDAGPQDDGSMASNPPADAPPPPPPPGSGSSNDSAQSDEAAQDGAPDPQAAALGGGNSDAMANGDSASSSTGSSSAGAPSSGSSSSGASSSGSMQRSEMQPLPPARVAPEVPRPMPEGDEVRRAYEEALQQSAATVTTAPAGLRDMNRSPVVNRRNTMPLPPSSLGEERVTLRPPPGVQAAGTLPGGEADAVVYFDNASSKISKNSRNELKNIVNLHKERGGRVRVVGHASSRTRNIDQVAHRLANFQISLERAQAVARELARLGVPADRIEVQAMADNDPVYYEVMPAGEAGNRRAEIFLDY